MWSILLSAWDISPLLSFQTGWSSRHWEREQHNRWILLLAAAGSIFPTTRMRTEDRCLTGVTTSSAPPDCLAPVLPDLNQSEASLWSPDLLSQWEASLATLSQGRIYQDYVLWRPGGNISTSWQCWTSEPALSIENRKHYEVNIKTGNTDFRLTDPPPSSDARGGKTCRNAPVIGFC